SPRRRTRRTCGTSVRAPWRAWEMAPGLARSRSQRRSLDDLIGAGDERRRNFKAERLGRPEINDQFKLRRLLDRQVSAPRALENLVDKPRGTVIKVGVVHTVAQEPADLGELAGWVRGR